MTTFWRVFPTRCSWACPNSMDSRLDGNTKKKFVLEPVIESLGNAEFVVKVAEGVPFDTDLILESQGGALFRTDEIGPGTVFYDGIGEDALYWITLELGAGETTSQKVSFFPSSEGFSDVQITDSEFGGGKSYKGISLGVSSARLKVPRVSLQLPGSPRQYLERGGCVQGSGSFRHCLI